ncbi:survival motor neuron protein-like isoform X2 [Watersipora subatra]|uniref:survival motor neuron protein-like isoform X2 n=1 Tax=Watersipora subatra TaxID=2589382 RepID=UPI00355C2ACA
MASSASADDKVDVEVEQGTVVFVNDGVDTGSDIWDDTALIKAYDKAIKQAHQSNNGLKPPKTKKKKNKSKKSTDSNSWKWSVGNRCRAVYSEDGYTYDAVITQMLPEDNCVVRYTDYGNEEEQAIKDLLRPQRPVRHSTGKAESLHSDTGCSSCSSKRGSIASLPQSYTQHTAQGHDHSPSFIPPPPPVLPNLPACNTEEAFHSMLISWYMSGFHTGYYQGLRDGKDS